MLKNQGPTNLQRGRLSETPAESGPDSDDKSGKSGCYRVECECVKTQIPPAFSRVELQFQPSQKGLRFCCRDTRLKSVVSLANQTMTVSSVLYLVR